MKPDVTAFFDEATNTVSYVVRDPSGSACAIIDSVLDFFNNFLEYLHHLIVCSLY